VFSSPTARTLILDRRHSTPTRPTNTRSARARGGIRTHTLPTGAGGFKTGRERPACPLQSIWPGQGHRRVRRDRLHPGRPAWYPRVLCTFRAPRAGAFRACISPGGGGSDREQAASILARRQQSSPREHGRSRATQSAPVRGVDGIRDGMTVSRSRWPVGHTQAVVGVRVGGASRTLTPQAESEWIELPTAA
jgi:hypothetical protein